MTDFEGLRVTLVPVAGVPKLWPVVRDMLELAVSRSGGRWTMHDVLEAILLGNQQLWVAYDANGTVQAACTTLITVYPNARFVGIQFLGGKAMSLWAEEGWNMMKKFAKDHACVGIEIIGRLGFEKTVKKLGFVKKCAMYEYSLERLHQ